MQVMNISASETGSFHITQAYKKNPPWGMMAEPVPFSDRQLVFPRSKSV
jgi:hypothetical protein